MHLHPVLRAIALFAVAAILAVAQDPARLMQTPEVKAALDAVKINEPHFIDEQIRICEIPAPPFKEDARGQELSRLFKQLELENVHIDQAGNVIGTRPGACGASEPGLLRASGYRFPRRHRRQSQARRHTFEGAGHRR